MLGEATTTEILPAQMVETLTRSLAFREIHHRVGNTLAILVASLRFEFKTVTGPRLQEALLRHERQIIAVGKLHQFFAAERDEGELSTFTYFQRLCDLLTCAILAPIGVSCEVHICNRTLPVERRVPLGLIIAELVTNAAKHAFRDIGSGRVSVHISSRGSVWSCVVSDNGAGIQRNTRGTGSQIVDGLIKALNGTLRWETGPKGTAVSVIFDA